MKLHHELDLPNLFNPQALDIISDRLSVGQGNYRILFPDQILSKELLAELKKLDVQPIFIILFQNLKNSADYDQRVLHRDITWCRNTHKWISMSTGINVEISKSENTWSWYDIGDLDESFPQPNEANFKTLTYLNGVHCVKRIAKGIPPTAKFLDQKKIMNKPVLVRTDIHHITKYHSNEPRTAISIRFDESKFYRCFDQAYELFRPVMS